MTGKRIAQRRLSGAKSSSAAARRSWRSPCASRYAVRVWGDALGGRGILPGDALVATLTYLGGEWWLRLSDAGREPVPVRDEAAEVWAMVCGLVRKDV